MGDINVYTGPMKCGKSNKIIEEAKRQMIAGKQIKIFKPQIDTRFAEDYITDRNGNKLKSVNINKIEDIKKYDADVYVIDEVTTKNGYKKIDLSNISINVYKIKEEDKYQIDYVRVDKDGKEMGRAESRKTENGTHVKGEQPFDID